MISGDDELPTNVDHAYVATYSLDSLPPECLSGDPIKPLRHVDDQGTVSHYALQPLLYCVLLILVVECFERFSFYSICYTLTMYLTGVYDPDWNAELTSVDAASFVAIATAIAYTSTFIGATLADAVCGEYVSILVGALGLYVPGLLLLALTTVPYLLGDTFNHYVLTVALLLFWPLGTVSAPKKRNCIPPWKEFSFWNANHIVFGNLNLFRELSRVSSMFLVPNSSIPCYNLH